MPAITASVTLRIPPELLEVIDSCRGDISRNEWMVTALQWAYANRGAVERALGDVEGSVRVEAHAPGMGDVRDVDSRPAPAEQPEPPSTFDRLQGAREFRPYPKGREAVSEDCEHEARPIKPPPLVSYSALPQCGAADVHGVREMRGAAAAAAQPDAPVDDLGLA